MTTLSTIIGNVVADIELRTSQAGKPWCQVRVASTPREKDRQTGEYKDGESMFVTVKLFGQYAENVAQSLGKGNRITATGKIKFRSYKDNQGADRSVIEMDEVESIGPDLRWATAQVTRSGSRQGGASASGGASTDQWASPPASSAQQPHSDPSGFSDGFGDAGQPF